MQILFTCIEKILNEICFSLGQYGQLIVSRNFILYSMILVGWVLCRIFHCRHCSLISLVHFIGIFHIFLSYSIWNFFPEWYTSRSWIFEAAYFGSRLFIAITSSSSQYCGCADAWGTLDFFFHFKGIALKSAFYSNQIDGDLPTMLAISLMMRNSPSSLKSYCSEIQHRFIPAVHIQHTILS